MMSKRNSLEGTESGGKKFKVNVEENYFLKLNDDCLDLIFRQLRLQDQINLTLTCHFLEGAFFSRSKVEYKQLHINILQNLPLLSARKFLEMAGPQIQNLFGRVPSKNTEDILEHVKLFCTNINVLTLCSTKLDKHMFTGIVQQMPMITDLRLYNLSITDDCVRSLKMLPNLKNLTLRKNSKITGMFIKDIVNMETLSLKDSRRIKHRHFVELCESLTNLKSLDIRGCRNVLDEIHNQINKHLNNLEAFKLTSGYADNLHFMFIMPNLKHLYVEGRILFSMLYIRMQQKLETLSICKFPSKDIAYPNISLQMLKKLIIQPYTVFTDDHFRIATSPNLEVISLSYGLHFSAHGLLAIIKELRKLHTLYIEGCYQLNFSFAKDVFNLVKNERSERRLRRPLIIWAGRSNINLGSFSHSELDSVADLVYFNLDEEPKRPDDWNVLCAEADKFDFDYTVLQKKTFSI